MFHCYKHCDGNCDCSIRDVVQSSNTVLLIWAAVIKYFPNTTGASQMALVVKNPPANAGDAG